MLAPVLGIADVRTDKRIDFVGGIRGAAELERLVDAGAVAVAFSLYPVTVGDLMHDRRRRRHHAAEVHVVRAEAARRPAVAPDLGGRAGRAGGARQVGLAAHCPHLTTARPPTAHMNILIADKFEAVRDRRPAQPGCDVMYEPDLKGEALDRRRCESSGAQVLDRPLDAGDRSDARRRAAVADRARRRGRQHDRRRRRRPAAASMCRTARARTPSPSPSWRSR